MFPQMTQKSHDLSFRTPDFDLNYLWLFIGEDGMSVLRLTALVVVLTLCSGLAPPPVQASKVVPGGVQILSASDQTQQSDALASKPGIRLAQSDGHAFPGAGSLPQIHPLLPLGFGLLGALLVGLAVSEFRRSGASRT